MRFDRSRVAALACAAVGSAAVGAYLLDPAYYDALASRFLGRMSSPEGPSDPSEKNNEKTDSPRTSDIGAIRSLLATTSLREFLAARHVGRPELAPPEDVLVLTPSCTVSEALAKLAEKSVLSAPLLRDDRREILGFVSVGDILGALITHMFPPGPCGYVATTEAPEWFLIDDTPDAAERVTKMVVDKADAFCAVPPSATYAARQAAATARGCCWTRPTSDPTLLDVIQTYFVDNASLWNTHRAKSDSLLERHSSRRSNHRVAAYERAEDGVRSREGRVFALGRDPFPVAMGTHQALPDPVLGRGPRHRHHRRERHRHERHRAPRLRHHAQARRQRARRRPAARGRVPGGVVSGHGARLAAKHGARADPARRQRLRVRPAPHHRGALRRARDARGRLRARAARRLRIGRGDGNSRPTRRRRRARTRSSAARSATASSDPGGCW